MPQFGLRSYDQHRLGVLDAPMKPTKGWHEAPEPPKPQSWWRRIVAKSQKQKSAHKPTNNWWGYALAAGSLVAFSIWLILRDIFIQLSWDLPGVQIGTSLICGLCAALFIGFRNPDTAIRRAFVASSMLTVSSFVFALGVPTGIKIAGYSIEWIVPDLSLLLAILVINVLLYFAQRQNP